MRSKDLIIADIKNLVKSKGYIYSFCLILFEDFHVNLETLHEIDYRARLSVKEATLILGFLVQNKLDFSTPNSPESVIELKEKTYSLMEELHLSYTSPQIEKLKVRFQEAKQGIHVADTYKDRFDFFVSDGGMVEPMFYAGDGVYDFQYLEYLEPKYKYDKDWLLKNKNFDISQAVAICNKIKSIIQEKSSQVNLVGLRELAPKIQKESQKKLKKKYDEESFQKLLISAEFYQYINLFPVPPAENDVVSEKIRSENWSQFYQNLLGLFVIRKSQFSGGEQIDSFCENFSFKPGGDINKDYNGAGSFNILTSKPIIRIDEDRCFVPINYLVAEAVYESPFYWMCEDKNYSDQLAKHRGDVGEEMSFNYLSKVFGEKNTFKSVTISTQKGKRDTDIDVLCMLGNKALCVQVKSKKVTLSAKKGDTNQLVKDFKGAVQDAYNQGLVCREKILNKKAKFFDEDGNELHLPEYITEVYIMGVTTENYPALTHQSFILLQKKDTDPFPLFLSIFDLELVAHYLNDPYDFLYYIRQRITLMDYFRADEEMVYLGYHLQNKLWRDENASIMNLDTSYGAIIDRNYFPLKSGYSHLVSDSNDPIRNLWKDEHFDKLCSEIKRLQASQVTDIIFHLLDWSGEGRSNLVANLIKLKEQTSLDGEMHTMSTSTPPDFGISYISLNSNEPFELKDKLLTYSKVRKYRCKCNAWLGIGSLKGSDRLVDYLVYNDENWNYDSELEMLAKQLLDSNKDRKVILFSNNKKIGRNDICPCGSGLKFKKCCGKNI